MDPTFSPLVYLGGAVPWTSHKDQRGGLKTVSDASEFGMFMKCHTACSVNVPA